MKHAWLVALMASVATPAVAQQYQYVAHTEAPAARQGAVTAGILTWQCQGSACTISGPWPAPAAQACAQLAREVGRIVSYGREGNMLGAPGLATCNAGIAAAAAPTLRLPPRVVAAGPLITVRPQPQPQSQEQPQPAPQQQSQEQPQPAPEPQSQEQPQPAPSGSIAVTTPELSFVVNAEATERPADVAVNVTAPELSFIVSAEAAQTAPPETVNVTTPELSFVIR